MSKRSNFPRRMHDAYQTPLKPVLRLIPHLQDEGVVRFAEPCAGEGNLVGHLEGFGFQCCYADDIAWPDGIDALTSDRGSLGHPDAIVTNPPWTRQRLH